jgi:hypothetical protein
VLSNEDIADLLGTKDATQVLRHETNPMSPQLELTLLYSILFKIPMMDFFPNQRQALINRLRLRIPNIINEMKCVGTTNLVNSKIKCLQDILIDLNNDKIL